jgi:hypothetical protein
VLMAVLDAARHPAGKHTSVDAELTACHGCVL